MATIFISIMIVPVLFHQINQDGVKKCDYNEYVGAWVPSHVSLIMSIGRR